MLSPELAKKMIFLYGCYVRDDGGITTRQRVAKERSANFIRRRSISCQISRNEATEDFTKFLNSLCAWIYYPDDEDNDDEGEEVDGMEAA